MGFLLCVCMLAALGLWIVFLTPANPTPDAWLTETPPFDEERAGYSGGRARIAPGFTSNGEPHNEEVQQLDTPASDEVDLLQLASSSVGLQPERTADAIDSEQMVVTPQTQALATQATPSSSPKPGLANRSADVSLLPPTSHEQPALPESGMGEITITALMPGARVDVADYVITEAPITLRVPWPAKYTVAVHVDEATVYETQVHLSAENNRLSFAVDAVDPESGVG